ncbi:hypothetical protein J4Q44_G00384900 [Coregonus suidteri]|uniref:Uncharacterized protein n=1 Tax=Coregonus suidteri TaxID=861788 RepID=A0AAN8KEU8_9TELE
MQIFINANVPPATSHGSLEDSGGFPSWELKKHRQVKRLPDSQTDMGCCFSGTEGDGEGDTKHGGDNGYSQRLCHVWHVHPHVCLAATP